MWHFSKPVNYYHPWAFTFFIAHNSVASMKSRALDSQQKHMSSYFVQCPKWIQWEFGNNKGCIIMLIMSGSNVRQLFLFSVFLVNIIWRSSWKEIFRVLPFLLLQYILSLATLLLINVSTSLFQVISIRTIFSQFHTPPQSHRCALIWTFFSNFSVYCRNPICHLKKITPFPSFLFPLTTELF